MAYTLNIDSSKGRLSVTWNNVEQLARYANIQSGFYLQNSPSHDQNFFVKHFQQWNQMLWNHRSKLGMLDFPKGAKILDIGSGIAVVDLLLYSYILESQFYLLDEFEEDLESLATVLPNKPFAYDYPFYSSWEPVTDAITASGFSPKRFTLLSVSDTFPEDLDAVTSYFSWCFHYPKEHYWNRALNSLKKGGKLILDVRPMHDRDVIGEISEQLKSEPVKFTYPLLERYVDTFTPAEQGITGYRCMWTNNS